MQGQSGLERRGIRVAGIELGLVGGSAGETVNRDEILLASGESSIWVNSSIVNRAAREVPPKCADRAIAKSLVGVTRGVGIERAEQDPATASAPRNEDAGSQMLPSARRSGVKFVCVSFPNRTYCRFSRRGIVDQKRAVEISTKLTDA